MAALQTAMFPILVIRLPKREGDGAEEAGRHLKRKTRIRGVFGEGDEEKNGRDGREEKGRAKSDRCGISRAIFRGASFLLRGPHKHFLSRGNGAPLPFLLSFPLYPAPSPPPALASSLPHVLRG